VQSCWTYVERHSDEKDIVETHQEDCAAIISYNLPLMMLLMVICPQRRENAMLKIDEGDTFKSLGSVGCWRKGKQQSRVQIPSTLGPLPSTLLIRYNQAPETAEEFLAGRFCSKYCCSFLTETSGRRLRRSRRDMASR